MIDATMMSIHDAGSTCAAIAARSASPLVLMSKRLSPLKQRLFNAAYSSMRLIDDRVDNRGVGEEPSIHAALDAWSNALREAFAGRVGTMDCGDDQASIVELADLLPRTDLSNEPWSALIDAMRRDLDCRRIESWQDFDAYALGASVAPTQLFLYLLLADECDGRLSCAQDLSSWAKPLGFYCYLAHILRDLVEDASQGCHLLTLPCSIIEPFDTIEDFAQGLSTNDPRCRSARLRIIERAKSFEPSCQLIIDSIEAMGGKHEAHFILVRLVGHYRGLLIVR